MAKTRHLQARMSQRGIKLELVELTQRFGVIDGDKFVLNQKGLSYLLQEIRLIEQQALELQKKGGLVVVACDGTEITAYRLDSYKRAS